MTNTLNQLWDRLFPLGHHIEVDGDNLFGRAQTQAGDVFVLGTTNHAAINSDIALKLSAALIQCMEQSQDAPLPIVMIADTQGQELSRREEFLGLNGYFAHLAKTVHAARCRGHKLITLIHGEAVSGGFLAFGLLADRIIALPNAEVRVMDLRAMSRITRIDYVRLQELAQNSPVFAPGAQNYWRMGGIHELWQEGDDWAQALVSQLSATTGDERAQLGRERGGRELAQLVVERIVNDATVATAS